MMNYDETAAFAKSCQQRICAEADGAARRYNEEHGEPGMSSAYARGYETPSVRGLLWALAPICATCTESVCDMKPAFCWSLRRRVETAARPVNWGRVARTKFERDAVSVIA